MAPNNGTVPHDLIANVLVWLPVKSLMRFKCVDRCWDDLFRTPTFIKNHHSLMQIRRKKEQEELLMVCHDGHHYRIISESQSHEDEYVDITYMFPELDYQYLIDSYMDGHCNGLFTLFAIVRERDRDEECKLLLWNPATREVNLLPPTSHGPTYSDYSYVLRGFGFDPNSSHEFGFEPKVVCISFESQPPTAEIYSLRTNSWTLLPNHNLPLNLGAVPDISSFFVNGVCYWVNSVRDKDYYKILSFDFRNNQFHILNPPSNVVDVFGIIAEVNGSVAYVDNYWDRDRSFTRVWILEQDGSWTEMYHLGPYDVSNRIYAISQDGAKFLGCSDEDRWVSYSSEGHSVRHFLQSPGFPGHLKVRWYVESIAPLSF